MNHLRILLLLLFFSSSISAQNTVQQTIDNQVWRPFIQAYNTLDAQAFLAVHTSDVIRIIRDGDQIRQGAAYAENVQASVERQQARNLNRTIELRFTERFTDGDLAFEAGYYKVVNTYSETEQYTFFGRFNVILRKENGIWKIFVDSDTNDGGTIGEAEFLKGSPMD